MEDCKWWNLGEDDFIEDEDLGYWMGEFVWSGFDYLGEGRGYYRNWGSER